jgi:hypothetical protein
MLKTKLYKILILTVVAVSACSCNKFLELRPQDGVVRDEFWQSKEQLLSAVIGCYTSMLVPGTGDRAPAESFFIWGELRADMISPGIGMGIEETNIINANILSTNPFTTWESIYRVINLCNTVIDFGPGVLEKDNTLTQQQLNAYLSEALTIRSLMYFYLARTFGDVPIKLNATASDNDLVLLAKSTQKEVLDQIVADLKVAEGYAVPTYNNNAYDKGRITRYTVNALQADVYLWMDNYSECIAACDKIINSGRYGLVQSSAQGWFNALYVAGNSIESIFELQYDQQLLNPYFAMFQPGRPRYKANPLVIEEFYTLNLDDENIKDIRGADASVRVSDQTIYKYLGLDENTLRTPDVSFAHWIVYRFADILLMKAEACANSNRGLETLSIINQIRTRARALPATEQNPGFEDVNGLTDYILAERAREFAFEGKRWYDLLRNAKRNNYARLDILTTAALRVVSAAVQQSALNKLKDPNSHYLPIFQFEIQADPNLIQNPFYK